jgi:hypothetical protein
MEAIGGRTRLVQDLPPPIEALYSAQTYIERRLNTKWLPSFLSTPQFAERLRLSSVSMGHVVDDVIMQRRRRALMIQRVSLHTNYYNFTTCRPISWLCTRQLDIGTVLIDASIHDGRTDGKPDSGHSIRGNAKRCIFHKKMVALY